MKTFNQLIVTHLPIAITLLCTSYHTLAAYNGGLDLTESQTSAVAHVINYPLTAHNVIYPVPPLITADSRLIYAPQTVISASSGNRFNDGTTATADYYPTSFRAAGNAYADTNGTFWAFATVVDSSTPAYRPEGIWSNATLVQKFTKDTSDAALQFSFTSGYIELGGEYFIARGDLQASFSAFQGDQLPFWEFSQDVTMVVTDDQDRFLPGITTVTTPFGTPLGHDLHTFGPMTYTIDDWASESNLYFGKSLTLDPYTGLVDLSSVGVGEEFTVVFDIHAAATSTTYEIAASRAYFRDPVSPVEGQGISFTSSGLTALAPVPVPAAAWLFSLGLLGLLGVARRKS